jgi:hypothetical protein
LFERASRALLISDGDEDIPFLQIFLGSYGTTCPACLNRAGFEEWATSVKWGEQYLEKWLATKELSKEL